MSKTLVVKNPKRGTTRSLSIVAAGVVAVGGFLWLTPADSRDREATPTTQPAAFASTGDASTAAVDLVSYCGSSENGPVELDYEGLDMQGVDRTPVDLALASLIR